MSPSDGANLLSPPTDVRLPWSLLFRAFSDSNCIFHFPTNCTRTV